MLVQNQAGSLLRPGQFPVLITLNALVDIGVKTKESLCDLMFIRVRWLSREVILESFGA